jgi:hypothetical protein
MDEKGAVEPLIYRNTGAKGSIPVFAATRKTERGDKFVYYPAGPSCDVDRDGRTDLFLINWFRGNHSRLLRNVSDSGNWLDIEVQGETFNRQGIGTKIRIMTGGKLLGAQEMATGYGYASGQIARCHFGLGEVKEVDVELVFPNGKTRRIESVKDVNQLLTIKE